MSWIESVWAARRRGDLTGEESWQVIIDVREEPDPEAVVGHVLRGLAAARSATLGPDPRRVLDPDLVVIEGL